MALNKDRLKNKIIATMQQIRTEEDNPEQSMEKFADELALAIVEEIKQITINYTSGLMAPNGAVTGSLDSVMIE
ncbi:hypothetical protein GO491_03095 [Flavobacteriaceae bacterium Ap0902]|nr:hypothetical protein [Flavobacteriaceae bacterium Ap0902]